MPSKKHRRGREVAPAPSPRGVQDAAELIRALAQMIEQQSQQTPHNRPRPRPRPRQQQRGANQRQARRLPAGLQSWKPVPERAAVHQSAMWNAGPPVTAPAPTAAAPPPHAQGATENNITGMLEEEKEFQKLLERFVDLATQHITLLSDFSALTEQVFRHSAAHVTSNMTPLYWCRFATCMYSSHSPEDLRLHLQSQVHRSVLEAWSCAAADADPGVQGAAQLWRDQLQRAEVAEQYYSQLRRQAEEEWVESFLLVPIIAPPNRMPWRTFSLEDDEDILAN